ncbi:alpha/beta hydrolase [Saccharibacillus sp. JS10]|uniref:alpha/beta hydrolase n=1 Tax=Saccharibacillus sp. JS10 TaxID=2950552 RepID=UPI00210AE9BF|nr:alpha/beta hydrolase fold domain-containing protein [Saccharibacillus sp. JS10]MCQ4086482.1 alpha/beta hydrolase fold domain-containing protein [Saccharibacillus sp. JS10]
MGYTGGYGFSSSANNRRGGRIRTFGTIALLIANLIALALGIAYLFVDSPAGIWNLYGILLLFALLGNLHLAMGRGVHKSWEYVYLALHALGLTAVPILNTLASSAVRDYDARSTVTVVIMLALFALGAGVSFLRLQYGTEEREERGGGRGYSSYGSQSKRSGSKIIISIVKVLLTLWFLANLLIGLYFSAILLGGAKAGWMETILPEYALFFGLSFLGAAALLVKMYGRKRGFLISLFRGTVRVCGLLILLITVLPLASTPKIVNEAQKAYEQGFGKDPMKIQGENMMRSAFSLPDYFYGARNGDYRVKTDIVFYEGQKSTGDEGLKLAFDAYMPLKDAKNLPGKGSVLIRIHGGGWTIGDKGAGNYAQMNKYFASRGYVVFDVQYGLSNAKKFIESAVVPPQVVGDYGIDDMVRHIGLFTTYLEEHAAEYGANPASVFISGGSAGGQLAAAAGLAPTTQDYANVLAPGITVKGIIPYYPANGLAADVNVKDGRLGDPATLVNADSTPALIYQGENDSIVKRETAEAFVKAYQEAGNKQVALVEMPFGTHGSDMYFASYYNEPFTYMMERFMKQYQ